MAVLCSAFDMPENYAAYFNQLAQNYGPESQINAFQPQNTFAQSDLSKFSVFRDESDRPKQRKQRRASGKGILSKSQQLEELIDKKLKLAKKIKLETIKKRNSQKRRLSFNKPKLNQWNEEVLTPIHYMQYDDRQDPIFLSPNALQDLEDYYEAEADQTQNQLYDDYAFDIKNNLLQAKINEKMDKLGEAGYWTEPIDDSFDEPPQTADFNSGDFKVTRDDLCSFLLSKYSYDCSAPQQQVIWQQGTPQPVWEQLGLFMDTHGDIDPFANPLYQGETEVNNPEFVKEKRIFDSLLREIQHYKSLRAQSQPAVESVPQFIPVPVPVMVVPQQPEFQAPQFEESSQSVPFEQDDGSDYFDSYFPQKHIHKIASDQYLEQLNSVIDKISEQPKAAVQETTTLLKTAVQETTSKPAMTVKTVVKPKVNLNKMSDVPRKKPKTELPIDPLQQPSSNSEIPEEKSAQLELEKSNVQKLDSSESGPQNDKMNEMGSQTSQLSIQPSDEVFSDNTVVKSGKVDVLVDPKTTIKTQKHKKISSIIVDKPINAVPKSEESSVDSEFKKLVGNDISNKLGIENAQGENSAVGSQKVAVENQEPAVAAAQTDAELAQQTSPEKVRKRKLKRRLKFDI